MVAHDEYLQNDHWINGTNAQIGCVFHNKIEATEHTFFACRCLLRLLLLFKFILYSNARFRLSFFSISCLPFVCRGIFSFAVVLYYLKRNKLSQSIYRRVWNAFTLITKCFLSFCKSPVFQMHRIATERETTVDRWCWGQKKSLDHVQWKFTLQFLFFLFFIVMITSILRRIVNRRGNKPVVQIRSFWESSREHFAFFFETRQCNKQRVFSMSWRRLWSLRGMKEKERKKLCSVFVLRRLYN